MSNKPTIEDLELKIFNTLIATLNKKLEEPDCPASVIKEARELLKDNGIEATASNSKIKDIADNITKLPFSADG